MSDYHQRAISDRELDGVERVCRANAISNPHLDPCTMATSRKDCFRSTEQVVRALTEILCYRGEDADVS